MKRIDEIAACIRNYTYSLNPEDFRSGGRPPGLDAETVARELDLLRNNVSRELNRLCRDGILKKMGGRPVRFLHAGALEQKFPVKYQESVRARTEPEHRSPETMCQEPAIVGIEDSLKSRAELARAAVIYPGKSLNTILVGPTGVGKTLFAEMMYRYGVGQGVLAPDARFVAFNCADYAGNPQLLLSQLFGYVKGAFTGADRDRPGLVDRADGGVLLLDEVHRLPYEGQEMLFYLLDKGVYRRLGESDMNRTARIFLIAATTEDPEKTLLNTFLRRLPMRIDMPTLAQRSQQERFNLVRRFYAREASSTGLPIRVSPEALLALLHYDCPGNVGQLKADIQLSCACGYLNRTRTQSEGIDISLNDLPESVLKNLPDPGIILRDREENQRYARGLIQNPEQTVAAIQMDYNRLVPEMLRQLDALFKGFQVNSQEVTAQNTEAKARRILKEFLQELNLLNWDPDDLYAQLGPPIPEAVRMASGELYEQKGFLLGDEVMMILALHLSSRDTGPGDVLFPYLESALLSGEELELGRVLQSALNRHLPVRLTGNDLRLFALLLRYLGDNPEETPRRVGLVVASRAGSASREILRTATGETGVQTGISVDLSGADETEAMLGMLSDAVCRADQGRGVLLLTDRYEYLILGEILTGRTGIYVRTHYGISTGTVMAVQSRILMPGLRLEELVRDLETLRPSVRKETFFPLQGKKRVLLVEAVGGIRHSVRMADWLNSMEILRDSDLMAVGGRTADLGTDLRFHGLSLAAVITGRTTLRDVPVISFEEILSGDGFVKLQRLADHDNPDTRMPESVLFREEMALITLRRFLEFSSPRKVLIFLTRVLEEMGARNTVYLSEGTYLRFIIHCGCMIERLFKGNALYHKHPDQVFSRLPGALQALKKGFLALEENFGLTIPDTEYAYILELLEDDLAPQYPVEGMGNGVSQQSV